MIKQTFKGSNELEVQTNSNITTLTPINQLPSEVQPAITNFFENSQGHNSLSGQELETIINKLKNENTQPIDYLPYILGGVGIVAVIAVVIALIMNNNNKRK